MTEKKPLVNLHQISQEWVSEEVGTGDKTDTNTETKSTVQQCKTWTQDFFIFFFFSVNDIQENIFVRLFPTQKYTQVWAIINSTLVPWAAVIKAFKRTYRKHSLMLKVMKVTHTFPLLQTISLETLSEKLEISKFWERNFNEEQRPRMFVWSF